MPETCDTIPSSWAIATDGSLNVAWRATACIANLLVFGVSEPPRAATRLKPRTPARGWAPAAGQKRHYGPLMLLTGKSAMMGVHRPVLLLGATVESDHEPDRQVVPSLLASGESRSQRSRMARDTPAAAPLLPVRGVL